MSTNAPIKYTDEELKRWREWLKNSKPKFPAPPPKKPQIIIKIEK